MNTWRSDKLSGFALLGTLAGLLFLGVILAGLLSMMVFNQSTRNAQQNKHQAYYNNIAGSEYALRQIRVEGDPKPIPTREFSGETWQFTRTSKGCNIENLVVSATESAAANSYFITSNTNANIPSCLDADTTTVDWDPANKRIKNLKISKISSCTTPFYVTGAKISWLPDLGQKIKKIRFQNGPYQYNATDLSSGSTFDFTPNDFLMNTGDYIEVERIEFDNQMDIADPTVTIEWILDDGAGGCGAIPPFKLHP